MAEEGKKAADEAMGGAGAEVEEDPSAADKELGARMALAQQVFRYTCSDELVPDKAALKASILEAIEKDAMAPYYEAVCARLGWDVDVALLDGLKARNAAELKKLADKLEDAKENHGENEELEAHLARAEFFDRIGDKAEALKLFDGAPQKPQSLGQKIDILLRTIRTGLFHMDLSIVKERVTKCHELIERGGDWDRRNRLKVYEGTYAMANRDFKKASELFLSSVATFNSYEMYTYKQFVWYTVLTSLKALDRVELKRKVVDSSEILSVILELPHVPEFLNAFYEGRYADFFGALVALDSSIRTDRFMGRHIVYFVREMRVLAYTQFLESYKSVTVDSMAAAFGVSAPFLDRELAAFIATGRVNAKIDKVGGIIETNRPDARNAQYQSVIKQGDVLLNRLQSLARVVSA
mmetsp:Transcript_83183/g.231492  ORF Transcript_83183/g.231492 Transcript_83183/m.231492 type:complete len:410 (-) Transcript_83183:93-1322(-)